MSFAADDLTPLLVPDAGPGETVRFGQGIVQAFDPITCTNTIRYRGAVLTDLPVLNTSEAVLLKPGSVVGILAWKNTYFILGRITIPNTPQAGTALDAIRVYSHAAYEFAEPSTGGSYVDLEGGPVVPDVLISKSGRALVLVTATIVPRPQSTNGSAFLGMSFAVSGATTLSPDPTRERATALDADSGNVGNEEATTTAVLLDGTVNPTLNPGLHTFTAKYKKALFGTGSSVAVYNRILTVIPF